MPFTPPRPGGSDPESRWFQWAHDSILSLRPQDVAGSLVHRTSRGTVIIPKSITQKGGGGPVQVARYIIDAAPKVNPNDANELLVAFLSGATIFAHKYPTGSQKQILLPFKLREFLGRSNIDGIVIEYSSYDERHQTRVATMKPPTPPPLLAELQVIVPRYLPGDEIVVLEAPDGDTNLFGGKDGVDLNVDGRAWARRYNQAF